MKFPTPYKVSPNLPKTLAIESLSNNATKSFHPFQAIRQEGRWKCTILFALPDRKASRVVVFIFSKTKPKSRRLGPQHLTLVMGLNSTSITELMSGTK